MQNLHRTLAEELKGQKELGIHRHGEEDNTKKANY